jgi:hypothetical protein
MFVLLEPELMLEIDRCQHRWMLCSDESPRVNALLMCRGVLNA